MAKKENTSGAWVIVIVVIIAFLTIIFTGVNYSQREATKKKCQDNNQVYVEESNTCRELYAGAHVAR